MLTDPAIPDELPLPRFRVDPAYALDRKAAYHKGATGYDDLTQNRNQAIARVVEAMNALARAGRGFQAAPKATLTRRKRELALTVGDEWHSAMQLAEELHRECVAWETNREARERAIVTLILLPKARELAERLGKDPEWVRQRSATNVFWAERMIEELEAELAAR